LEWAWLHGNIVFVGWGVGLGTMVASLLNITISITFPGEKNFHYFDCSDGIVWDKLLLGCFV